MRIPILALAALAIFGIAPVMAAGDHVELSNIGVTVSSEEEQTRITLYMDGEVKPVMLDATDKNIIIYDLPGVELTAADEGVTSVTVFSPSVASIKLTQIGDDPYLTRFEIYVNGPRECMIEPSEVGYDFVVYPAGSPPKPAVIEEEEPVAEPPEEVIEAPVEEEPIPEYEEPAEEPVAEVEEVPVEEEVKEEAGGINLLEGVNLLTREEEPAAEVEEPVEEPVDEPVEEAVVEPWVPPADFVRLDSFNYQVGDADTDVLVFTMADDYLGQVRTNFIHKKGFIVLTHCDVSQYLMPGEFKTVALQGEHLRYVVMNINDKNEVVFSLILMNPEAKYNMETTTTGNQVRAYLKLAE